MEVSCSDLCAGMCAKPLTTPDRWDDATAITGYTGGNRQPNWRLNNQFDEEPFNDLNANSLYDEGEPFSDANGNGVFDQELYDPILTGYNAGPGGGNVLAPGGDVGLQIVFHPGQLADAPIPGQYLPVAYPALNRGTPVTGLPAFTAALDSCDSNLVGPSDAIRLPAEYVTSQVTAWAQDLIARDPDAYWDPATMSVQGSKFAQSPRVVLLTANDPRTLLFAGRTLQTTVTRLLGVFIEQTLGPGEFYARLVRVQTSGEVCGAGYGSGGFAIACTVPARATTWGQIKARYR